METSSRQRGPGQSLRARVTSSLFSSSRGPEPKENDFGNTPPRAMGSWKTSGPTANARQAPSSVMAGRKLFNNRSQNPPRTGVNTTRSFSDLPTTTPGKVFASSSFRSGLANGNNSKFTFSPRVPHNTMRESFPAVTPGRSVRGSSVDIGGRAMSKASSSHLFQMRIASPPPELDGEELAKQVPESSSRVGSVYADEFLSHLVPPELDDLQRRQFLCILDLRRLKYAATEIFAKKDWRVNIMNFAKEYEKSRSLIMLRYGLYEFKTVPASRELLKKWKQENDIADEDEEMADDSTPKSNGNSRNFRSSVKRRAEDDLTKDEVSTSFSSTPNKRRATDREPLGETAAPFSNAGATPMPKKSKRGADAMDMSNENQPTKLQKSKPSTTLSIFEEIANNSPARNTASPAKSASKSSSITAPSLFSQPSSQTALSKTSAFGSNIFGHLSEQNTPKGSGDEESEAGDSDHDVEEVEEEEPALAKKSEDSSAAPLLGSSATPSMFAPKPSTTATGTAGGSLFDRMSKGADGALLKAADTELSKPSEERPASPAKQSLPQDKTWNPNTPIKFGATQAQTSTPLFGASTTQQSSLFSKPTDTPTFGTQAKDFATETPKPAAPSLFGAKPSEPGTSLFGNNANKSFAFGKPEEKVEAAAPATPSIFGVSAASTTPFGKPAETPAPAKALFGGLNTTPAPSTGPSLFGTAAAADKSAGSLFGATNGDKPAAPASLFSNKNTTEDKKEESSAKRKKSSDDDAPERPAKTFSFGGPAPTPAQNLPPKTAAAANGATDAASVFGAADSEKKTYSFGAAPTAAAAVAPAATPTPAPAASTSLFGNLSTTQTEPAKTQPSIFASSTAPSTGFGFGSDNATASTPAPIFGASAPTTSFDASKGFSFGGNAEPAATGGSSFTFNAGSADSFNNPFAKNGDSAPSFQFGAQNQTPAASASAFQFAGGNSTPAPAPSTSFTFGAGSQPASGTTPAAPIFGASATNGGSSMFNFAGASQQPAPAPIFGGVQPANAAQGIFASQLAVPPPGSSTGTNTPLFGGASSLATTPATGTPEPEAVKKDTPKENETADEDGAPQDQQVSLTDGGPGEEDEEVVHEVRAKALRHVSPKADGEDDDDDDKDKKKPASPWRTEGVGPLRVLKHKTTGVVRMLLRTEPSGKIALNKMVLPGIEYKADKGAKWIKVITAKDIGKGLETWMLQVRNNEFAVKLAAVLQEHKVANKRDTKE